MDIRKDDIVEHVAMMNGITKKDATAMIESFIEYVMEQVAQGNNVKIQNFGTFYSKLRAEREVLNPQTKERMKVKSQKVPKFKVGKGFKDLVKYGKKR